MAQSSNSRIRLINILGYKALTRDGYLVLANRNGQTIGYADMLEIKGHQLSNLPRTQINYIIYKFYHFVLSLPTNIEMIVLPTSNRNHQQKQYWNNHLEDIYHKLQHPDQLNGKQAISLKNKQEDLNNVIKKLKIASKRLISKRYLLVVFDTNEARLKQDIDNLTYSVLHLSRLQKFLILYHLKNPVTNLNNKVITYLARDNIKHSNSISLIDNPLFQDQFNFTYNYIHNNNSYYAFLDFCGIPSSTHLPVFWLASLANQPNVISFLSIGSQSDIQNSFATYFASKFNHNLRNINFHLMIYSSNFNKLMSHLKALKHEFLAINLEQITGKKHQKEHLKAIFRPISLQKKVFSNNTKMIDAKTLSTSYMFNFNQLKDPNGEYLGYTYTNGEFCFNPFYIDTNERKSTLLKQLRLDAYLRGDFIRTPDILDKHQRLIKYRHGENRTRCFSLIAGDTGMGKSTLAKQLESDAYLRGYYIRNFDKTGEYRKLIKHQGGKIIDTYQPKNQINPLEIFPTITKANGDIDVVASFNENINRIIIVVKLLNSGLNYDDLTLLNNELVHFYVKRGMWTLNPKDNLDKIHIMNLPHDQYPTISEFTSYLKHRSKVINKQVHPVKNDIIRINHLIYASENIEKQYGKLLNQHTTLSNKVESSKLIDFDFSKLIEYLVGSENRNAMPLICAQFFDYLFLIIKDAIKNKSKHKNTQCPYYYINVDEAESYLNPNYPNVTHLIANMMVEMRKDFCAITFIMPTLKDILLNNKDYSNNKNYASYQIQIKRIFNLIQYFHLFRLESNDVKSLKRFFKENNVVNLEQLYILQNLAPHQLLTIIINEQSYRWQDELTNHESHLFE